MSSFRKLIRRIGKLVGIRQVLEWSGFRLVPSALVTLDPSRLSQYSESNNAFLNLYKLADETANPPDHRSPDDFGKQRRFYVLRQMAEHVIQKDVVGDFAECGCKYGHSTYIVADAIARSDRHFWVFDSFEGGLSDKVAKDRIGRGDTDPKVTHDQKKSFSSGFDTVKNTFSEWSFIHFRRGWIPEVLTEEFRKKTYAFVHIDVDLYVPTKASLEFFFPQLSEGGVIIVDDYGSAVFPGAQKAVDEFVKEHSLSLFLVNHLLGCIIIK